MSSCLKFCFTFCKGPTRKESKEQKEPIDPPAQPGILLFPTYFEFSLWI